MQRPDASAFGSRRSGIMQIHIAVVRSLVDPGSNFSD